MGKQLTLILGGARSGKSDFAQALAQRRGGRDVLFLATAEGLDDEMRSRIQSHRAERPDGWKTLEAPRHPGLALQTAPSSRLVLLDCVTLWVSNVLLANASAGAPAMLSELDELLAWYENSSLELMLVSNEVGMSIVPENALARAYRDLLGLVNRKLADRADQVFWLVAGLPVEVKSLAVRLEDL
jgi:adenosyl cobinamide kinase/adenosyl cobinamide phosphate guanylyltransferase